MDFFERILQDLELNRNYLDIIEENIVIPAEEVIQLNNDIEICTEETKALLEFSPEKAAKSACNL